MNDLDDDIFGNVIFTYTRAEAIADGEQKLLEGELAEICKSNGYKYPIYVSERAPPLDSSRTVAV